jgi:DNA replication and repair protein RecF
MRIDELKLRSFRNYTALDLLPGEDLNVLVGENAQGKSNLLEAIYLLATSKSLRATRESELVRHSAELATVTAQVAREREPDVEVELTIFATDKKSVRLNGVKRSRVLELLGQLNAVFFGSIDLAIVSGEPSVRRRYLNLEISQISPKYVFDLAAYKKVLEQRNRLLRDLRERPYRDSGLDAWDEQLVHYGAPLIEKRRFFIDRLAPIAAEIHSDITDRRESLEVRYLPHVAAPTNANAKGIAEAFRQHIRSVAADEIRRGVSLVGPQRDEVQFLIDGLDARTYGSQGQQRTVVLSLKLAEHRLMEEYVGEAPVMLLDDVMSDLDDTRQEHLMQWIQGRGQIFLSCTNLRQFSPEVLSTARVYSVVSGTVTPVTDASVLKKGERTDSGPGDARPTEKVRGTKGKVTA